MYVNTREKFKQMIHFTIYGQFWAAVGVCDLLGSRGKMRENVREMPTAIVGWQGQGERSRKFRISRPAGRACSKGVRQGVRERERENCTINTYTYLNLSLNKNSTYTYVFMLLNY